MLSKRNKYIFTWRIIYIFKYVVIPTNRFYLNGGPNFNSLATDFCLWIPHLLNVIASQMAASDILSSSAKSEMVLASRMIFICTRLPRFAL